MLALTLLLVAAVTSQTVTNIATLSPSFTVSQGSGGTYLPLTNQILFAEQSIGQISAADLTAPTANQSTFSANVASGTSMSLVTGSGVQGGQIRLDTWAGPLALRPQGTSYFYYVGPLDAATFASLDHSRLQTFGPYTQNYILFNSLVVGSVIAVSDNYPQACCNLNYAKIRVSAIDNTTKTLTLDWTSYLNAARKEVIATGFNGPVDVVPSADGTAYYISEQYGGGAVYRLPKIPGATKAQATLLFGSVRSSQLYLDGGAAKLYAVENAPSSGRVLSYDLTSSTLTTVYTGLVNAVGLAGDPTVTPLTQLYVSEAAGTISVIDLQAHTKTVLYSGFTSPKFLAFEYLSKRLYVPQASTVGILDFSTSPPTYSSVVGLSSASKVIPTNLLGQIGVTGSNYLDIVQLTGSSYFSPSGPLFEGIGFVPITKIVNGLATVKDPNYAIYVEDSPFGGSLTPIINFELARQLGYTHYSVSFAPIGTGYKYVTNPYGDYKWDNSLNQFAYSVTTPTDRYYPIRSAADWWLNSQWGGLVDTTSIPSGTATLAVTFYKKTFFYFNGITFPLYLNQTEAAVNIVIDNVWPQASIDQVYYVNTSGAVPVDACAIVQGTSTLFYFQITATDPDQHVLSYGLGAVWGANKGASIFSDTYSPNHVVAANPARPWAGIVATNVPLPAGTYWNAAYPGDPTSTHCAHTFYLNVWDRSHNGFNYLHKTGYTLSLTFLVG